MNEERTGKCLQQVEHICGTFDTFHDGRMCIIKTFVNSLCFRNCVCNSYFHVLYTRIVIDKNHVEIKVFFYQIFQLCPAWFVFVLQEIVT